MIGPTPQRRSDADPRPPDRTAPAACTVSTVCSTPATRRRPEPVESSTRALDSRAISSPKGARQVSLPRAARRTAAAGRSPPGSPKEQPCRRDHASTSASKRARRAARRSGRRQARGGRRRGCRRRAGDAQQAAEDRVLARAGEWSRTTRRPSSWSPAVGEDRVHVAGMCGRRVRTKSSNASARALGGGDPRASARARMQQREEGAGNES